MANNTAKGQVYSLTATAAIVVVLRGPWKDRVYQMPLRPGLSERQFVDLTIHPGGYRADWPR